MANSKKKKNKKKKHLLGKKEFIFNFVSLVLILGIALYFGGRSLYYYSKQNMKMKDSAMTLNGILLQNNQVQNTGDLGLFQDSDGYFFKGNVTNNYLIMGNIIYRVMRVNNDDSVQIIPDNYVSSFIWGDDSSYQKSNVKYWLEKGEDEYSGVYYNTLPDVSKYFDKTKYHENKLKGDKIDVSKKEYQDYVSLLNVSDYILASGKNSYLNNGQLFFLLGYDEDDNNLYVEEDGSIQSCESTVGYGIRPVLTLKKNQTIAGGDGTKDNPYIINIDQDKYYINKYVKLGDDVWVVYEDKNNILRLYLYGYINSNGIEVVRNYSITNSIFDLTDKNNIAYYLNLMYYSNLSYQNYLVDNDYYIGEISDDLGYSLKNIYANKVTCKVGLLNIFDYNPNAAFNDFFFINTTSLVGSMEYNRYSNGLIEEADVREEKHIVPTVSILSSSIVGGNGSLDDPYVLG